MEAEAGDMHCFIRSAMVTECFFIFIDIAYSCTCREGNSRPEMGEVELMLERALELQEKADSYKASLCAFVPQHKSRADSDGVEVKNFGYGSKEYEFID
ncbi:hypothetical protein GOBAR_AA04838 [Gossypium barbadense]|uniref:Uncharacterized protein n=1 Tax=Gossypium barbadense TaxID=3634 RepID=A0A2P5YJI2_GOSBA|nr:hypothetical protein GOBAR_AA04838 [Gossypium barbadense]